MILLLWILLLAAAAALSRPHGAAALENAAWVRRPAGAPRRPHTLPLELARFEGVSPRHAREAELQAREFERRFQRTFDPAAGAAPDEAVRGLFAARAGALQALHEIRMRLPNDLDLERALAAATEDCDRLMLEHIEDARERTGAVLLHPGPVDAAWYGRWCRASNDVVT